MSYAAITFEDRNPIKRWLQRRRLTTAVDLSRHLCRPLEAICDYGAGNGELCKVLAAQHPGAKIICYEPTPSLLAEASQNLSGLANVELCRDVQNVAPGTVDLIFCLEVFEHLPPEETADALRTISKLLKPEGTTVIGVPVEVGIPALYKGIFRMGRRYGGFDANFKNVALSFVGLPPRDRPTTEIAPGFRFHHEHTGFDVRAFEKTLRAHFLVRKVAASPFSALGAFLMPEVYFVAERVPAHG